MNRLNNIYRGMKTRCYNSKRQEYYRYGGRGITVCKEWLASDHKTHKGWKSFEKWSLENGYAENKTLDRIDNNKGYSPENCRWVDIKTQANNKTNNHFITYKGNTKTIKQWAEDFGINEHTLGTRIRKNNQTTENIFSNKNLRLRMITYNNKTQSLKDWCRELQLNYYTVHCRITRRGWTIEEAFTGKKSVDKT